MKRLLPCVLFAVTMLSSSLVAAEYYVAPTGNDENPGTAEKPRATLAAAADLLKAGDTLWVQPGTYEKQPHIRLRQAGKKGSPITIQAAPGQRPVIDFGGEPGDGVAITAAWWHIKGITFAHAGHNAVHIEGFMAYSNIIENVTAWANGNTGMHIGYAASDNTFLNCDSYENFDPAKHGQDADGFGAKNDVGSGNKFVGCRSWHNSDDGFDMWYAGSGVRFENCYAWGNGENIWKDPKFEGNGNGFKLGQRQGKHVLTNCVVWDQPHGGFDLNGNSSGVTVTNCTAFHCGNNFQFTSVQGNADKNVLHNNISFEGGVRIDPRMDDKNNSWNTPGLELTKADFRCLDPNSIEGPRGADGSLPKSDFLHLTPKSKAKGFGAFPEP
jgi:hypothetical protein